MKIPREVSKKADRRRQTDSWLYEKVYFFTVLTAFALVFVCVCVCVCVFHLNVFVTEVVLESGLQRPSADAAGYTTRILRH